MTKRQFIWKLDMMLDDEFLEWLKEICLKKFQSGGVDPEDYEDNFLLPKICLYVALREARFQYKPLQKHDLKIAKNLEHF